MAVLDVISDSFDESEENILTDILRTEIFKTQLFSIVERGLIQQVLTENRISLGGGINDSQLMKVGRSLSVDKLLICKVESLAESTVINLRMIDMESSMLDYTENVFVDDRNEIFQALSDLVVQFKIFFQSNNENLSLEKRREIVRQNWIFLGADEEDLLFLAEGSLEPSDYMELRQYDINFTVKDYIVILKNGWDRDVIRSFFREGIPYHEVQEALGLGIGDLNNYQSSYKPYGLSFTEYLDAYRNNILSASHYIRFKKGYDKDFLRIGAGGVADSLPIMNASFSFLVLKAGWEHYLTDFQRDFQKYSIEMGANFFQGYLPTPYFQGNYYLGQYPFYGKVSLGGVAEVLVGGHYGAYVSLGMELGGSFEFTVMSTLWGTQPEISYTDLETEKGEDGYVDINFPYLGVFFCYKLSDLSSLGLP
ncbi:MAG: CsgG/HfaB family protein [Spirochaetales bacterium]|nr:CsgG/HfaB family protein [Spirochaetales bacterium]